MKINSFNSNPYAQQSNADDKVNKKQSQVDARDSEGSARSKAQTANANSKDVLDISAETQKRLSIRNKIDSGFYDRREVLAATAGKMLNSIDFTS